MNFEGKIRVHYTGVDLDTFELADRAEAKATLDFNGPVVLCVGALIPRKGQDLLVRALPMLPDGSPDWNAYYTGRPTPGAQIFAPVSPTPAPSAAAPTPEAEPSASTAADAAPESSVSVDSDTSSDAVAESAADGPADDSADPPRQS